MPSLALLIPAYNAARFLPRLFEAVAAQEGRFDEVWVYDDCSTDGTHKVAEKFGARVVRGDVNRGCTYGKSILIQKTKCDWVHFHDADDLLLPNFITMARHWLSHDDVDVVIFGCEERWDRSNQLISVTSPVDAMLVLDAVGYTIRNKINAISGLYRRNAFIAAGGFDLDPDVLYNEDQAYHCSLARAGLRFRGDETTTVLNLRQETSMWTKNQDRCLRSHYHVMCKALYAPGGENHKRAIAEQLWHVASGSSAMLDWRTADGAATLAMQIAGPEMAASSVAFRVLCKVSPRVAVRVREWLIRILKSRYREGYPGWRAPISML